MALSVRRQIQAGLKAAGFRLPGSGYGYGPDLYGWFGRTLPGTQFDFRSEAGALWENGAFAACLRWLQDTWTEAPMCVRTRDANNRWVTDPTHAAEAWFNEPSPYYDASVLWYGTLLSLKADGNAYWYKVRSRAGRMVGVIYLPHFLVTPRWTAGGSTFIETYEYRPDGTPIQLDPANVVHLRIGMDPFQMRRGLKLMDAVLREVCTENEIATFHAAVLRNGGFPGAVVSPEGAHNGQPAMLTKQQRDEFREQWKERFSKDGAGEVFVQSIPVKVQVPGWKPSEMMMDKIRGLNSSYICAAFGLDPMVVGLPSETKTFANYEEARQGAYDNLVLPLHRVIGRQLDRQVLPELVGSNPVNQRIGWDYQDVRELREDRAKIYPVLSQAVGGRPWLTVNEARSIVDFKPLAGADELEAQEAPGVEGARGRGGEGEKGPRGALAEAKWDGQPRQAGGKFGPGKMPKPGEVEPTGDGEFGPIYAQFKGRPADAIAQLVIAQDGEVPGAFHRDDLGDIDLVWGNAGPVKGKGYGLAKVDKWHPEMLTILPDVISKGTVEAYDPGDISRTITHGENSATVKLLWMREQKTWLLTAYGAEGDADLGAAARSLIARVRRGTHGR